jgi:YfiH family protein
LQDIHQSHIRQPHIRQPKWLNQVHGTEIVEADGNSNIPDADACISRTPGLPAVVMTADCLPVLLCDQAGSVVAAVHAGWRSLANGIIRKTVVAMGVDISSLFAYLGPAISRQHFEVGTEVKEHFLRETISSDHSQKINDSFVVSSSDKNKEYADLYSLARAELLVLGVTAIYGGEYCTYEQQNLFFSYRRDGQTGRMASLIWLT